MADIPKWWMKGDWFDACSCNIGCPCKFAQAPTNNKCEGFLAYHIREGEFDDVRLDGFNALGVVQFEGNAWTAETGIVDLGLFLDERADEKQREALQLVFTGQAGGWMAKFAQLIGSVRGIEFVPITLEVADDLAHWRAEIPNKVTASAEALAGPTTPPGERVQLHNAPGSETGPGETVTFGTANDHHVDAYGFQWDWAGKSSAHIPFDWTGPA